MAWNWMDFLIINYNRQSALIQEIISTLLQNDQIYSFPTKIRIKNTPSPSHRQNGGRQKKSLLQINTQIFMEHNSWKNSSRLKGYTKTILLSSIFCSYQSNGARIKKKPLRVSHISTNTCWGHSIVRWENEDWSAGQRKICRYITIIR